VHDHTKSRYFVNVPELELRAEVHSVFALDAWSNQARERYDYQAAYRCPNPHKNINRYQVYLEEGITAPKAYLELWEGELKSVDKITIVPKILAYQPEAFLEVQRGDIFDQGQSLLNCGYENISPLSIPVYPPLGSRVSWHLLCYLAMAYKNLDELENLKILLLQHDFATMHGDRYQGMGQKIADSLHQFSQEAVVRFHKGEALRGFKTVLSIKDEAFLNLGELFLFGSLIAKIFADHAPFNSFNELEIQGVSSNIVLNWPV
jgi:hypothetical protein